MRSKRWFLNLRDFVHGATIAMLVAAGTFLQNELSASSTMDMAMVKRLGIASAIGFIAYICKALLQNSKGELLKPEDK
jgi:hypothetical protein